jgi:glycosyltransferase involved in cell wall biosynthesis
MTSTEAAGPSSQSLGHRRTREVCVLLSTYNGEAHLEAQLESLKTQNGVTVDLHVRDDGSTDRTCEILRRHAGLWPGLAGIVPNDNLGPARSFLALLRSAPDKFEHYAFCDQDDVWMPDKLVRAIETRPLQELRLGGVTSLGHLLWAYP